MTRSERVVAPFDDVQIASLNAYQGRPDDALVCPSVMCGAVLVAGRDGLGCPSPVCEYSQEWAYAHMLDRSWQRGGGDTGAV